MVAISLKIKCFIAEVSTNIMKNDTVVLKRRDVTGSGQLSTSAEQFPVGNPEWGTRKLSAVAYPITVVPLQPDS